MAPENRKPEENRREEGGLSLLKILNLRKTCGKTYFRRESFIPIDNKTKYSMTFTKKKYFLSIKRVLIGAIQTKRKYIKCCVIFLKPED